VDCHAAVAVGTALAAEVKGPSYVPFL